MLSSHTAQIKCLKVCDFVAMIHLFPSIGHSSNWLITLLLHDLCLLIPVLNLSVPYESDHFFPICKKKCSKINSPGWLVFWSVCAKYFYFIYSLRWLPFSGTNHLCFCFTGCTRAGFGCSERWIHILQEKMKRLLWMMESATMRTYKEQRINLTTIVIILIKCCKNICFCFVLTGKSFLGLQI